ncbi:MAG: response regulator receiver protein [Gammaproteobacteria bacterium]|nr:MAG: response regulator receiver protein [Gammaproteobacteria bacterium]
MRMSRVIKKEIDLGGSVANDENRPAKAVSVLVVDDDAMMRLLMMESLGLSGFEVIEAENGLQAVELFQTKQPDLVLLDVEMPGMDGYSACMKIRALPGGDHTPILMVTGLEDVDAVHRAYEVGATDFISKPVNWIILAHRVKYMLRAADLFGELRLSETRNQALIKAVPDLMIRVDRDGFCLSSQPGEADFTLRYELENKSSVGSHITELLPSRICAQIIGLMAEVIKSGESVSFEGMVAGDGHAYYYEARLVVCGNEQLLAIIRDITERTLAEQQVRYLAFFDELTGLPNRQNILNSMEVMITNSDSTKQIPVLFLDLDHFKRINDTLGHSVGDLLLCGVAERLRECMQDLQFAPSAVDSEKHFLGRFGGDEFVVLLAALQSVDHEKICIIVKQILISLAKPFLLNSHEVFITPSIGVSVFPENGRTPDELIKHADLAKRYAKENGCNSYEFYDQKMNSRSDRRLVIENNLRRAMERDEFKVFYQPQLDVRTGQIIGVEALMRWTNAELGSVSPADFIPIAEEMGLIIEFGEWVLRQSCSQMKCWLDQGFDLQRIAVNLSSIQFYQSNLMKVLDDVLSATKLNPCHLELELTEGVIMRNATKTIEALNEIKARGISLSVDDFGTGYSSLSYLKRFPIDALKIDRSFIAELESDAESAAITSAVIAMAHSLNLKVIAEGVENVEQLNLLRAKECDEIQGFYFSKPVPADEISAMLKAKVRLS